MKVDEVAPRTRSTGLSCRSIESREELLRLLPLRVSGALVWIARHDYNRKAYTTVCYTS